MTFAPIASHRGAESAPGAAAELAPRGRALNPEWQHDRREVARLYAWLEWRGAGISLDEIGHFIAHAEEWTSEYEAMIADEDAR